VTAAPAAPARHLPGHDKEVDLTMAYANTAHHAALRGNDLGFVARLRKNWADWLEYRRTLDELRALTDRDLQDLGLSRFAIQEIAYESVYGNK
jgi:uncharacterized protein YjiS (DUF1127 family)